jgi:hypothetical protein
MGDPHMIGGRLERLADGRVLIRGVDHGALGIVLAENEDLVVIKWPGRTCYLDRMSGSRYYSPEVFVCRKELRDGECVVKPLLGWNAGRKKG